MVSTVTKAAAEIEDFTINWSPRLGTDTIATSSFSVSPSGMSITSTSNTTTTATVWLSGGTINVQYTVTNLVTTAGGRTYEQQFNCFITP